MEEMDMSCPGFIVECDYVGRHEGDMSLESGTFIKVLVMDDDQWWYGLHPDTGKEGWFPSNYGVMNTSFFMEQISGLKAVLQQLISNEQTFVESLEAFISTIVKPMQIRDTHFKRTFLSDASLALTFNLMSELLSSSLSFLQSLRMVDTLDEYESIASCITDLSPSLRLFSQYIAENSNALNALKAHALGLQRFLRELSLPPDTSLESYLLLPVVHFGHYMLHIDDLMHYAILLDRAERLQAGNMACRSDLQLLLEAGEILRVYAHEADRHHEVERKKQVLLRIQSQFINNPPLYAPHREFIREAELDVLTPSSGYCEQRHVHLLSDALILSTRVAGMFKFEQAIDLSTARLEDVSASISVHSFSLSQVVSTYSNPDTLLVFRCHGPLQLAEWKESIQCAQALLAASVGQALCAKERRMSSVMLMAKRRSQHILRSGSVGSNGTTAIVRSDSDLEGSPLSTPTHRLDRLDVEKYLAVETDALPGQQRVRVVLQFMRQEFLHEKELLHFHQIAVEPLIDASKGAELSLGLPVTEDDSIASPPLPSNATPPSQLFSRRGSYVDVIGSIASRRKVQSVQEALCDPDMQIFLRSVQNIVSSLSEFLLLLEMNLLEGGLQDERVAIGPVCTSPQAQSLYQQLKSYASGHQAAIRVLRSPSVKKFTARVEGKLAELHPSWEGMDRFIRQVLEFPHRLTVCLKHLHVCTPDELPDKQSIAQALRIVEALQNGIDSVISEKENFEKLLSIRDCFVPNILGQDAVLVNLVSNGRKFIYEGDLTKVCRKADKVFRFWLFSDYLVYATAVGGGMYKWNRALDIAYCRVKRRGGMGTEESRSFEIYGLEKSFVVLAANHEERERWVRSIESSSEARRECKKKQSRKYTSPQQSTLTDAAPITAPLWVPDHASSLCVVCNTVLGGFVNRKHHCRLCGNIVCGEHSAQRILLPHIHKSTPQRVCDTCFTSSTLKPERISMINPLASQVDTSLVVTRPSGPLVEIGMPASGVSERDEETGDGSSESSDKDSLALVRELQRADSSDSEVSDVGMTIDGVSTTVSTALPESVIYTHPPLAPGYLGTMEGDVGEPRSRAASLVPVSGRLSLATLHSIGKYNSSDSDDGSSDMTTEEYNMLDKVATALLTSRLEVEGMPSYDSSDVATDSNMFEMTPAPDCLGCALDTDFCPSEGVHTTVDNPGNSCGPPPKPPKRNHTNAPPVQEGHLETDSNTGAIPPPKPPKNIIM